MIFYLYKVYKITPKTKLMKKILCSLALSVSLLAITTHSAWSQLSIRPEIGYQFSLAGGQLGDSKFGYSNTTSTSVTGVYGSWGQGLAFGLALDYKFCPCFTLELGGRYWDGAQVSNSDVSSGASDVLDANLNLFVLSLGDYYDFCCDGSFDPYLGFGVDMGVGGSIKSTETTTTLGVSEVGTATTTASLPIGGYAEFGAKYHLSSHLSIFGELRYDALSLVANKKVVNSFSVNGVSQLSNLPLEETETDYVKSIPSSYSPSPTSPTQAIAPVAPASAWGINIGIVYNFGTWSKGSPSTTK